MECSKARSRMLSSTKSFGLELISLMAKKTIKPTNYSRTTSWDRETPDWVSLRGTWNNFIFGRFSKVTRLSTRHLPKDWLSCSRSTWLWKCGQQIESVKPTFTSTFYRRERAVKFLLVPDSSVTSFWTILSTRTTPFYRQRSHMTLCRWLILWNQETREAIQFAASF